MKLPKAQRTRNHRRISTLQQVRSFRWGRWGSLLALGVLALTFMGTSPAPSRYHRAALVLTVVGSINAGTADYIEEGIKKAHSGGAALVVLQMDTPGGFLQATRQIVKSILNAPLPVVVYVSPGGARAGSAGVFITLAGHIAAMSPGTNIGAAHPVTSGGKDPEKSGGKHMARKIENDTVAFVEAIARQRKRNVKWARQAVLESDSITWKKALELNVIDVVAPSLDALLAKIDGRTVTVGTKQVALQTKGMRIQTMPMSFKQKAVNFFSSPQIYYFLMMFGLLGILAEIYHPGAIFPGVLGAICLLLALIAMQALPINYGGFALIILGVILLFAELVTPTFGILFVGGLISLTVGSIFLIDSPDPSMRISLSTILPTVLTLGLLLGIALFAMLKTMGQPVLTGKEAMIGQTGVVQKMLSPEGTIQFEGELWSAITVDGQPAQPGDTVRIARVEGLKLYVIHHAAPAASPERS